MAPGKILRYAQDDKCQSIYAKQELGRLQALGFGHWALGTTAVPKAESPKPKAGCSRCPAFAKAAAGKLGGEIPAVGYSGCGLAVGLRKAQTSGELMPSWPKASTARTQ